MDDFIELVRPEIRNDQFGVMPRSSRGYFMELADRFDLVGCLT